MLTFHPRTDITSWGRVVRRPQLVASPSISRDVKAWAHGDAGARLAIGLRRSYGDTCLYTEGRLIEMTALDRIIQFDVASGLLKAQAGLSLDELLQVVVPQGWFVPVTPGTRFVTLGGAVANDVHGKNHSQKGTFGRHVRAVTLLRSDHGIAEVSPGSAQDLFSATVGGMGLTGVILDVTLQLEQIRSSALDTEIIPLNGLDDFFAVNDASIRNWEHTVAWIDCTRRGARRGMGVYTRAAWREQGDLTPHSSRMKRMPFELPGALINSVSLAAFNRLYRMAQLWKPRRSALHYASFFYPLDAIAEWNKAYGANGFYQYQCVVPAVTAQQSLREILDVIARSGEGSALAVLKTFGRQESPGMMSFPRPGYTLALDFHNRGDVTLNLLARLDTIIGAAGGALYPAKDGRMPRALFESSFPRLGQFLVHRDPACGSDFLSRIGIQP